MKTVADFYQDCLTAIGQQPPLEVQLADTVSYVLAEDVEVPFDLPVADLAVCDGYAVRSEDLAGARLKEEVELPVTEEIRAGDVNPAALVPGSAIRVASGAPMPAGSDSVIALDFTDRDLAKMRVRTQPAIGENIRRHVEDVERGEVVLRKGTRVGARQVVLLAGVGRSRVLVHPCPRIVTFSVGDEIVEPGPKAHPGTVFDTNGHALSTAVADVGAQTFRVAAVPDEPHLLRETIEDQLVRADLVPTTGGISYGSGDTAREVLSVLGIVHFDNVAAWPGHIPGAGTVGGDEDSKNGIPIFCLPGNPVSTQVCFEVFVRLALCHMQGWTQLTRPSVRAAVDRVWYSPRGRRGFVRVHLIGDPRDGYQAKVMGVPAPLLLSTLAESNALAVVPEVTTNVCVGDVLQCLVLK